jgi:SAM-dependent methyltransferase
MTAFDPSSYGDGAAPFYDQLYPAVESGLLATLAALANGGPALDLGIGTGRVAIPLHRLGIPVHGVEASSVMIAAFRAHPGSEDIPVVHGDFGSAALGSSYRLIYCLVSTFFLLPSLPLQQICLHNIARHLLPEGLFVSEAFSGMSSYPLADTTDIPIGTPSGIRPYRVTTLSTPLDVLDAMAARARLRLTERWSTWSRTPYLPVHPRHISVYRLAADDAT